jgi:hypothetical protein
MELAPTTYLFALASIATTFVGFSAIIMTFRQTSGAGLSPLDAWITLVFIQLGFLVTAGSLSPPLLELCGVPSSLIWRLCGGAVGAVVVVFAASYPPRRRAVSEERTPLFVWIELSLLTGSTVILLGNAVGRPLPPNPGSYSVGLTGILFTAGFGYLYALGSRNREVRRAQTSVSET